MRVAWLGDVLRDAGLWVIPVGRPAGRGHEMAAVHGIVGHDTVTTTAWPDEDVDLLLRDGRPDLPGPLAHLGLDRRGRFRWVADGRCHHNGHGRVWGNDAIGIEVYCAGGLAGHKETDPHRKIDPHGVDMAAVRRAVADRRHPEVPAVTTTRIAGADRYATAARICRRRFSPTETEIVYIMLDGSPDGQVAPLLGAPILLVETDRVPAPTAAALH